MATLALEDLRFEVPLLSGNNHIAWLQKFVFYFHERRSKLFRICKHSFETSLLLWRPAKIFEPAPVSRRSK